MERLRNLINQNTRIGRIVIGFLVFYALNKIYKKWKYSQKMFIKPNEIKSKVILITGCDTGFGNAIALKLSTEYGYRVIATCLKQESVDKFLSNSLYTSNKSTSIILDVTKKENINSVKHYTIKYLNDTNSILWGIVNNAGLFIPGSFEMVPFELDMLNRNILFFGPLNIIRSFLPLLVGRKNYVTNKSTKTVNNGGRIVNIASVAAHLVTDTRYGVSKASLRYFSHALRLELSPRFGIWVSSIEPGPFGTNIWKVANNWSNKVIKKLKENKQTELINIYEYNEEKVEPTMDKITKDLGPKLDAVINCVIHSLISKYPQRYYRPGWGLWFHIIALYLPYSVLEMVTHRNHINHSDDTV